MKIPITDPIEYLLRRKFDFLPSPDPGPVVLGVGRVMRKAGGAQRQEFEAYKAELQAKSPDEIRALYEAELAKHRAEEKAKAEREEQGRFFNQPYAKADFDHWSKAAHWTLEEAVALSFGKAPEVVNWKKVEPYVNISPFAKQYGQVRDLALRALRWQQVYDPVLPGIFLAWAARTDIAVPSELVAAVKARGVQVADWQSLYEQLAEQAAKAAEDYKAVIHGQQTTIDELTARCRALGAQLASRDTQPAESARAKDISTRERDSLLKLIIGMAIGGYGYDPSQRRSEKVSEIAADLDRAGVGLDVDTVRKWIKEASDLLPSKEAE
jgi:hypothetical protein